MSDTAKLSSDEIEVLTLVDVAEKCGTENDTLPSYGDRAYYESEYNRKVAEALESASLLPVDSEVRKDAYDRLV